MRDITKTFADFPQKDALRHALAPGGRESLAHMFVFEDEGLYGFLYPSLRHDGAGKVRFAVFGPGLAGPIQEEAEAQVPLEMGFEDWRLPPLRMAVEDPHKSVRIEWASERIQFHGIYQATFPVYAFSSHPRGVPAYYGDDRTEQHGRIVGTFVIDGKARQVDGWMARDHSWGPRVWGLNQHYKWFHATAGDVSCHFFEMWAFGRRTIGGYLAKDGVMNHIADATYDFTFDDGMMQQTFDAHVTDETGRAVDIHCRTLPQGTLQLGFDPISYLNEAAVSVEAEGRQGHGWVEFCWNRNYFEFAKDYVTQYA
jgi:hypothetical protein